MIDDPRVLQDILRYLSQLRKWYQSVRVEISPRGFAVVPHEKSPREIGKSLEDLVELALLELGCDVLPVDKPLKPIDESLYELFSRGDSEAQRKMCEKLHELKDYIVKDGMGWLWVYDTRAGKWRTRVCFLSYTFIPKSPYARMFENFGIVFTRHPNVRHKPDFESDSIAIEVKNRDPSHPWKTQRLFQRDVLDRFRSVRGKKRYLIIPGGVITHDQRIELERRGITEVNICEQLRRSNHAKVYESLCERLREIIESVYLRPVSM